MKRNRSKSEDIINSIDTASINNNNWSIKNIDGSRICKDESKEKTVFKLPDIFSQKRHLSKTSKHKTFGSETSWTKGEMKTPFLELSEKGKRTSLKWEKKGKTRILTSGDENTFAFHEMTAALREKILTKDKSRHSKNGSCNSSNNNQDDLNDEQESENTEEAIRQDIMGSQPDDDEGRFSSGSESSSEFNFDCKGTETVDLSTFEFDLDRQLPATNEPISIRQYKTYCEKFKVLPNRHVLRCLSSLRSDLRLRGHCLGTRPIMALCTTLLWNAYVQTLEISEDIIDQKAMAYLVVLLQENSVIENLLLRDNNMRRQPVKALMEFMCQYDSITVLSLAGNQLVDRDGDVLSAYVSATQQLAVLDLSYNRLKSDAAELLGKAFMTNTSINTLSLRWNYMGGDAIHKFVACLNKNRTLMNLDISWNGFNAKAVSALCRAFRVNDALASIDISSCHLTGPQFLEIFKSLKKNVSIKRMFIGGNILSDQDVVRLFQALLNLKGELALKELDMLDVNLIEEAHELVYQLLVVKDLLIYHGPIIGRYRSQHTDLDMLASMNPATVLIEWGNLLGKTIRELFDSIDEDRNGTLTREEIKEGLKKFDIPIPDRSVDLLIRKLDCDRDGVISFADLMTSRDRTPMTMLAGAIDTVDQTINPIQVDTERSRCRKILKRMLKNRAVLKEARELKKSMMERRTVNPEDGSRNLIFNLPSSTPTDGGKSD